MTIISAMILAALAAGCGKTAVDRDTWLITVGDDTVTVGEIGEAWAALGDNQKELFLSKENVIGEFIVTKGRSMLLEMELQETGYMDEEDLLALGECWLSEHITDEIEGVFMKQQEDAVTEEQIDYRFSHFGKTAFFVIDPGEETEVSYGPVHIAILPEDMIILMDSMEEGQSGTTESGMYFRLDSITTVDSATVAQFLSDTVAVRANIAQVIANNSFRALEDSLMNSLVEEYGLFTDTTALESVQMAFRDSTELPDDGVVLVTSDLGTWTVGDLKKKIAYWETRYSTNPTDLQWLISVMHQSVFDAYCRGLLEEQDPAALDSLVEESEKYMLDIASDRFYYDRIESVVEVTRDDMEELFNNLEEPMTVAERRVIQAVQMPMDSVDVYSRMSPEDREEFIAGLPGFGTLAADPEANPQITRPLTINQIPGFHGEEVFQIDPSDTTTWLGPLELYDNTQACMFRLIEVMPERNATFEEVEQQLLVMTRNKMEEQATVDVMRELEQKYNMTINEEILDKLPQDIGTWSNL